MQLGTSRPEPRLGGGGSEVGRVPLPLFLKIGRAVAWGCYAVVMVLITILILAFVLRLFGASTDASFVSSVNSRGVGHQRHQHHHHLGGPATDVA